MSLVVASTPCGLRSATLSLALHPSQIDILGSRHAGMVIGNCIITVIFSVLCGAAVLVARFGGQVLFPTFFEGMDSQGMLRFPSAPLFVFQFLYQGTTLGALTLVLYGDTATLVCLGALSSIGCLIAPVALFMQIREGVPRLAVYAPVASRQHSRVKTWILGPGEWCSKSILRHWALRYVAVLRPFREEVAWFGTVEMLAYYAISAAQALVPQNYIACGHQKLCCALIFTMLVFLRARVTPFQRPRDLVILELVHSLQALALTLMAVGYYNKDNDYYGFSIAADILLMCTALLVLKMIMDGVTELYVFCTHERKNIQEDVFKVYSVSVMYSNFTHTAAKRRSLGTQWTSELDIPERPAPSARETPVDLCTTSASSGVPDGGDDPATPLAPVPPATRPDGAMSLLGAFMAKRRKEQKEGMNTGDTADARSRFAYPKKPRRTKPQGKSHFDDEMLPISASASYASDSAGPDSPAPSPLPPKRKSMQHFLSPNTDALSTGDHSVSMSSHGDDASRPTLHLPRRNRSYTSSAASPTVGPLRSQSGFGIPPSRSPSTVIRSGRGGIGLGAIGRPQSLSGMLGERPETPTVMDTSHAADPAPIPARRLTTTPRDTHVQTPPPRPRRFTNIRSMAPPESGLDLAFRRTHSHFGSTASTKLEDTTSPALGISHSLCGSMRHSSTRVGTPEMVNWDSENDGEVEREAGDLRRSATLYPQRRSLVALQGESLEVISSVAPDRSPARHRQSPGLESLGPPRRSGLSRSTNHGWKLELGAEPALVPSKVKDVKDIKAVHELAK